MPNLRPALARWGWRALKTSYVALVGVVLGGLAGELLLRLERRAAEPEARRFRERSRLFAHSEELTAAGRSLWRPGRVWKEYKPGARLDLTVDGERYCVEINRQGFRTREFSSRKPAGAIRVLCLGGSTTVAGRTNDETYPALLERRLQSRYPDLPLEVLNLGISGTTTDYWLERREKLFGFAPDLVVQYAVVNDLAWHHLLRYAEEHPWRRRLHESLLLERLFPLPVRDFDPLFRETLQNLLTLEQECRRRDVAYIVGSFAAPDYDLAPADFQRHLDLNLDFWTGNFPLHDYREYQALLARYNELFELFAAERHLDRVLVHREIRDPALFLDLCHLTPEGIARLADVFLPAASRAVATRRARLRRAAD